MHLCGEDDLMALKRYKEKVNNFMANVENSEVPSQSAIEIEEEDFVDLNFDSSCHDTTWLESDTESPEDCIFEPLKESSGLNSLVDYLERQIPAVSSPLIQISTRTFTRPRKTASRPSLSSVICSKDRLQRRLTTTIEPTPGIISHIKELSRTQNRSISSSFANWEDVNEAPAEVLGVKTASKQSISLSILNRLRQLKESNNGPVSPIPPEPVPKFIVGADCKAMKPAQIFRDSSMWASGRESFIDIDTGRFSLSESMTGSFINQPLTGSFLHNPFLDHSSFSKVANEHYEQLEPTTFEDPCIQEKTNDDDDDRNGTFVRNRNETEIFEQNLHQIEKALNQRNLTDSGHESFVDIEANRLTLPESALAAGSIIDPLFKAKIVNEIRVISDREQSPKKIIDDPEENLIEVEDVITVDNNRTVVFNNDQTYDRHVEYHTFHIDDLNRTYGGNAQKSIQKNSKTFTQKSQSTPALNQNPANGFSSRLFDATFSRRSNSSQDGTYTRNSPVEERSFAAGTYTRNSPVDEDRMSESSSLGKENPENTSNTKKIASTPKTEKIDRESSEWQWSPIRRDSHENLAMRHGSPVHSAGDMSPLRKFNLTNIKVPQQELKLKPALIRLTGNFKRPASNVNGKASEVIKPLKPLKPVKEAVKGVSSIPGPATAASRGASCIPRPPSRLRPPQTRCSSEKNS